MKKDVNRQSTENVAYPYTRRDAAVLVEGGESSSPGRVQVTLVNASV